MPTDNDLRRSNDIEQLTRSIYELSSDIKALIARIDHTQDEVKEMSSTMKEHDKRLREVESALPLLKATSDAMEKVRAGVAVALITAAIIGGVVVRFAA